MSRPSFWTPERDQKLRELYPTTKAMDLRTRMQWECTVSMIHHRAYQLRIKKAELVPGNPHITIQHYRGYRVLTHKAGG